MIFICVSLCVLENHEYILNGWTVLDKIDWAYLTGRSKLRGWGSINAQSPVGLGLHSFSLESISSLVVGATRLCHTISESI